MSKRVLIITYYWPPAGGAGVQRWLKFVKYLPEFGWKPVVYTVKDGEYPALDPSLEKDVPPGITVIRRKIFEPYLYYKKFIGQNPSQKIQAGFLSEEEKPRRKERIARWIRGNLFIPDARRFWIRPSIRFLTRYLRKHPVDVIVSTGPPHSMHLIALGLKKKLKIPWVADFRDPWTQIDFYQELHLTRWADKKHQRLEREVVLHSDGIITVTRTMLEEFKKLGARNCHFIPNGFDSDDLPSEPLSPPEKFIITHAGSINPDRNPETLWKVLEEMTKDPIFAKALEIRLIGHVDVSVKRSIHEHHLESFTRFIPYLPHEEVLKAERQAAVLLLLINQTPNARGILTGKLFEYLAVGRPILLLGPIDGEAAVILKETGRGDVAAYHDVKTIETIVRSFFKSFTGGNPFNAGKKNINKYHRKTLTKELSSLLLTCCYNNSLRNISSR